MDNKDEFVKMVISLKEQAEAVKMVKNYLEEMVDTGKLAQRELEMLKSTNQ